MAHILIIDDDRMMCETLSRIVKSMEHRSTCALTCAEGLAAGRGETYDVVLLDVQLPDGSGLDLLPDIRRWPGSPEVIIITSMGSPDGAELAVKNGAWDYLEKPFSKQNIVLQLTRALQYREARQNAAGRTPALKRDGIIGSGIAISECLDCVARAAVSDAPVLITGETGTGKELFARAIHENSSRRRSNFVVVDCAAIPDTLIESSLFGSKKGAFTGAVQNVEGLVAQAHNGTLFLDEVGELPLHIQKIFLRVLQERRFRPLGASCEQSSDFRLVAATNRPLAEMAATGDTFRSDLLYRLQSIIINIPPLRERPEDIKELTRHYAGLICRRRSISIEGFSDDFFDALSNYPWPGNVRELINTIEWTLATATHKTTIHPNRLPDSIRIHRARASLKHKGTPRTSDTMQSHAKLPTLKQVRESAVNEAEITYLKRLIDAAGGDIKKACRLAGVARSYLYGLLKKHGLSLKKNPPGGAGLQELL